MPYSSQAVETVTACVIRAVQFALERNSIVRHYFLKVCRQWSVCGLFGCRFGGNTHLENCFAPGFLYVLPSFSVIFIFCRHITTSNFFQIPLCSLCNLMPTIAINPNSLGLVLPLDFTLANLDTKLCVKNFCRQLFYILRPLAAFRIL